MNASTIENALRDAGIPAHLITTDSDGAIQSPGLVVYKDEYEPGWAYRFVTLQHIDLDTMTWDNARQESGPADSLDDLREAITSSVEIARALEA